MGRGYVGRDLSIPICAEFWVLPNQISVPTIVSIGAVVELVDTWDLKSLARMSVRVQVPPASPYYRSTIYLV